MYSLVVLAMGLLDTDTARLITDPDSAVLTGVILVILLIYFLVLYQQLVLE
jgi:hypothetical protein